MSANGCVRCHSNMTPRRPIKGRSNGLVCINTPNCRRRQSKLWRKRAQTGFSKR